MPAVELTPIEKKLLGRFRYLIDEAHIRGVKVEQQVQIGPYRVDFLVTGSMPSTIVECDGHDWHERTKEQAARDKKRDRWLQAQGHRVFRFTGSEIHRRAIYCALESIHPAFDAHCRALGII